MHQDHRRLAEDDGYGEIPTTTRGGHQGPVLHHRQVRQMSPRIEGLLVGLFYGSTVVALIWLYT